MCGKRHERMTDKQTRRSKQTEKTNQERLTSRRKERPDFKKEKKHQIEQIQPNWQAKPTRWNKENTGTKIQPYKENSDTQWRSDGTTSQSQPFSSRPSPLTGQPKPTARLSQQHSWPHNGWWVNRYCQVLRYHIPEQMTVIIKGRGWRDCYETLWR